jgi:MFS family permease
MKLFSKLNFSKVIWFLTASDILVWGTATVGAPLVAIYLTSKFGNMTVQYIGIATAIYYTVRGIVQLPLGMLTDRIKSDSDEIALLILGSVCMGVPYLFYPLVTEPWHYYVLYAVVGFGASLNLNNWRKLFAKNIDKDKEGVTYGFYETIMSLLTGLFGLLGGLISSINAAAFEAVIVAIGIFICFGGLLNIGIYSIEKRKSAL